MKIGPKSEPRNFEIHAFHEIILGLKSQILETPKYVLYSQEI